MGADASRFGWAWLIAAVDEGHVAAALANSDEPHDASDKKMRSTANPEPLNVEKARALLRRRDLRATAPRLAVLQLLSRQRRPVSHSELLRQLDTDLWDPATVYRNLVKLTDVGLARVVSRADGMARYALVDDTDLGDHAHPHFNCERCGRVLCLPSPLRATMELDERWRAALREATLHFSGACPDCRDDMSGEGE